jgi:hypothetical protein
MRRYGRERQPTRMLRGSERMRLISLIVMLAVLFMIIVRARDVNNWRWLVKDDNKQAPAAKPGGKQKPAPAPLPAAKGPTDEDPEEAETAREEFQALTDGTLKLGPEEMEPYDRIVEWVKNQSFARLYQRATKGLRYSNLYDDPERHRGQVVALDLEIELASDAGKNRYGVPLYEAWGASDESSGRLYSLIVVDFPKGMPVGHRIHEHAKFAGYFLKLQGYEPGAAKPGQRPEKAPLLIGRLEWDPIVAPPADNTTEWLWGLPVLAMVVLAFFFHWAYGKWFRPKPAVRSLVSDAASGDVMPIETWLEQSSFPTDGDDAGRSDHHDVGRLDGGGTEGR